MTGTGKAMLIRHRIILDLLSRARTPLARTVFVKLVFLLRRETDLKTMSGFYDFVPYKYGPFSFTLYRDLDLLRESGFVTVGEEIALRENALDETRQETEKLAPSTASAVGDIVDRYAALPQNVLIERVYRKDPWFALNSERPERGSISPPRRKKAKPAIYTAGYEGKSVDAFFNDLLLGGIDVLIDVRANPVSRKYGFSKRLLDRICTSLGLDYHHVPSLGIPSSDRARLGSPASYRRLLDRYERSILPRRAAQVKELGGLMRRRPSVLMCVEKDVLCCHRSRLAEAAANITGLEAVHL